VIPARLSTGRESGDEQLNQASPLVEGELASGTNKFSHSGHPAIPPDFILAGRFFTFPADSDDSFL
jgi:hypothetical protein